MYLSLSIFVKKLRSYQFKKKNILMANNGEFSNDQPLKEAKITFLSSHTQGLRLIGFWCPVHGFQGLGLSVGSKAGVLSYSLKTIRGSLHVGVRY